MARTGDEIVICGRLFHTGAPVVLWTDPGGYDAYRIEKRFVPWERAQWGSGVSSSGGADAEHRGTQGPGSESRATQAPSPGTPNRYGLRFGEAGRGVAGAGQRLTDEDLERVRGGGWDLATLRKVVDQFVIHYDASGTSRQCFRTLHDVRGLSVHFMLDIDGTIYQTLDVKERAWHATTSNDRSVGVEIANIGAYPPEAAGVLDRWYREGHLTIPPEYGDGGVRTPAFLGAPIRAGPVTGVTQGRTLVQYDLTPQQYDSLIKLTATLCTVLPGIECNYPRDAHGDAFPDKLPDDRLGAYRGLLGHYHIQQDKADPGPAFQWERVIEGARALVGTPPG